MPRRFLRVWCVVTLLILVVLITGVVGVAVPAATEAPGEIGQQAYDDLAALYSEGHRQPDLSGAMQWLSGADPAARAAAGQYVLALLRQSLADESNAGPNGDAP